MIYSIILGKPNAKEVINVYQYKWRTPYSTAPSEIYNDKSELIGTITKTYNNIFMKIVDITLFNGKYFIEYVIQDPEGMVIVSSIENTNPFKKRQYTITYYDENKKTVIHLIDKRKIDIVEKTTFKYAGNLYQLEQKPFDWGRIKLDNNIIAEWKEPIKPPFNVKFNLIDKSYENKALLFIGIFHTYLNA